MTGIWTKRKRSKPTGSIDWLNYIFAPTPTRLPAILVLYYQIMIRLGKVPRRAYVRNLLSVRYEVQN